MRTSLLTIALALCFCTSAVAQLDETLKKADDAIENRDASGLSNDELRSAYREASCLLMTLEAATANNAILEAMACGLPIVSEDVGGVAEYCGSCCARLCAPGSAEALKESILTLYRDPDMVTRMSLRARERAEEFDWPVIAKRTVRLYDEVLTEAREKM